MATNLIKNPSFITSTTGWDGLISDINTGLKAQLYSGNNTVTLTIGTTAGMSVGDRVTRTGGFFGRFGNDGVVYVQTIVSSSVFTVGLEDGTSQNHGNAGVLYFSVGPVYLPPTLSLDSTDPLYGTGYSAKITAVDTSPNIGIVANSNYLAAVNAGSDYTFSAYVKVPVGQATSDFRLKVYNYFSTGVVSESPDSPSQTVSSYDGWVRLTFPFGPVSAGVTKVAVAVFRSSTTAVSIGYNFLVDGLQLETGSEATSLIYDQGQKNQLVDKSLTNVYIDHLKGMKLKADIRLGDFVFNRVDEYGVVWVISDVQGWNNLPEVQMQNFERGWGDGSFVSYGRYGTREITIEGSFLVQDVDNQLEEARERLIKAINLVKTDNWLIMNETTPKAVKVRLSSTPDITTTNPRGRTDFSFTLIAADPIKYKWDDARDDGYKLQRVNNSPTAYTTVRNNGNTQVPVIFEVIGPTTGPVSIFNKTTEDLLGVVSKLRNYVVNPVTSVSVTDNVATVTTSNATGVAVNDTVELVNLIDIYEVDRAQIASATTIVLTMAEKHNFAVNQRVYIAGLSSVANFTGVTNGDYAITAIYSSSNEYKLTITKSGTLTPYADTDVSGVALSISTNVSAVSYTSSNNIATYTTSATHGYKVGDTVVVANTTPIYDGTYVIDDVPSTTSFAISLYPNLVRRVEKYSSTYTRVYVYVDRDPVTFPVLVDDYIIISSLGTEYDGTYKVSFVDASSNATYAIVGYDTYIESPTGTVIGEGVANSTYATIQIQSLGANRSSSGLTAKAYLGNRFNGTYNVSGILIEYPEKFTVDANLGFDVPSRYQTTYNGATANYEVRRYNETLNIDTLNREIALNGEIGGYRSKLDTIVDWIYLEPGDNEINFTDISKKFVASVSYNKDVVAEEAEGPAYPRGTATIVTKTNHYLQVGASVTLSGLNTVNATVFANATVTILSIPNTQAFTYTPATASASNVASTIVTTGHIYEVSPSYLNIYYRSGWIG
jgi:hypothetical protein